MSGIPTAPQSEKPSQAEKGSLTEDAPSTPQDTEDFVDSPILRSVKFAKYVIFVLLYNLATVAWGVYVRASKSGDGCGVNWPLCDGKSIPLNGPVAKIVEASHRISTSLVGVVVFAMVVWAWQAFPKGHLVRKASAIAMGFTLLEGGIGMVLVKWQLVTNNDSSVRVAAMCFHVISTFFLVGSIAIAGLAANGARPIRMKGQSAVIWILGMGAFGMCSLAVSGAISALGHMLKPVDNVIVAALNPATNWMVRVQPLHPLIAVTVGLYLLLSAGLLQHLRPDPRVTIAVRWVVGLYGVQLVFGIFNIWLQAPIWMQMLHLAAADANWIAFVSVAVFALGRGIERVEMRPAPAEAHPDSVKLRGKELVMAYVALTKPRVISLLLFTTLTAAIAAKGGWPGFWLFSAIAVAGYMAAGGANAINMVFDRDIDLAMKRTATRPTVTQSISSQNALMFAFTLSIGAFGILWGAANLLSAVMAFSGLVFYVVVYTMLLKRRTWHNIVIGGAAGAFPPLVGWAAITNSLPPLALFLFAIIFVWTPVHFWSLALLIKDDYAAAGVPMLPVVKGDKNTVLQIFIYGLVTVAVTLIPFALHEVSWLYAGSAVILNGYLLYLCLRLYRQIDRKRASGLFHYSMLYLAILFAMLAADRTWLDGNRKNPSAKTSTLSVTLRRPSTGFVTTGNGPSKLRTFWSTVHGPDF